MKKINGQILIFISVSVATLILAMFGRQILVLFNLSDTIVENTVGEYVSGLIGAVIGAMLAVVSSGIVFDRESKRKEALHCQVLASMILNDINQNIKNLKNKFLWSILKKDPQYQIWISDAAKELEDDSDIGVLSAENRVEKIIELSQLSDDKRMFTEEDVKNLLELYQKIDSKLYVGVACEIVRYKIQKTVQQITKLYENIDKDFMRINKCTKLLKFIDNGDMPWHKNFSAIKISQCIAHDLLLNQDEEDKKCYDEKVAKGYMGSEIYICGIYKDKFLFSLPKDIIDLKQGIIYRILYQLYHKDDDFQPASPFAIQMPTNVEWKKEYGNNLAKELICHIENSIKEKRFIPEQYREHPFYYIYHKDWEIIISIRRKIKSEEKSSNIETPFSNVLQNDEKIDLDNYEEQHLRNLYFIVMIMLWHRQKNNKNFDNISFKNHFEEQMWSDIKSVVNKLEKVPVSIFINLSENIINELVELKVELAYDDKFPDEEYSNYDCLETISEIKDLLKQFNDNRIINGFKLGLFLERRATKNIDDGNFSTSFLISKDTSISEFFDYWQTISDKLQILNKDIQDWLQKHSVDIKFYKLCNTKLIEGVYDDVFLSLGAISFYELFSADNDKYNKLLNTLSEVTKLGNQVLYQIYWECVIQKSLDGLKIPIENLANNFSQLLYIEIPKFKQFIMEHDSDNFQKHLLIENPYHKNQMQNKPLDVLEKLANSK